MQPFDFFASLVFGGIGMKSVSLAGMISCLNIDITKQALNKHFTKSAVTFLQTILTLALQVCLFKKLNLEFLKVFSSVIIHDSTWLELNKKLKKVFSSFNGSCSNAFCKIQLGYNILVNQIDSVEVTKGTLNDNGYSPKLLKIIKHGSLVLVDLGYFSVSFFSQIHKKSAYFISRLKSGVKIFNPKTKKEINILKFLKKIKSNCFEVNVLLGVHIGLSLPCRLIGLKVPKKIAEQRRRKCKHRDGRIKNPKVITLELCDWTLIITNVPSNLLAAEKVHILYTLRWQIEIIFKQLKSILQLHKINCKNKHRAFCEIYAKLIAAVVITKLHGSLNIQSWNDTKSEISIEKFFKRIQERMFTFVLFLLSDVKKAFSFLLSQMKHFLKNCFKLKQHSRSTSLELLDSTPSLHFQKILLPLS